MDQEFIPTAEALASIVRRPTTYAFSGLLGPKAPHWPLQPYSEVCTRELSNWGTFPMMFDKEEGKNLDPNKYEDMAQYFNYEHEQCNLKLVLIGDQKIFKFAHKFVVEKKHDFLILPVPGPLHWHMNLCDMISVLWGEMLLWPCCQYLGRQGIPKISRSYQQLEDTIVVVAMAVLRALQAISENLKGKLVKQTHIGVNALDLSRLVDECGPRVGSLVLFLTQFALPYIYQRVCGRAGLSAEWIGMTQMWLKAFITSGKPHYAMLLRQWLSIWLNPKVSVGQRELILCSLFFRINPKLMTCIAADDLNEKVSREEKKKQKNVWSIHTFDAQASNFTLERQNLSSSVKSKDIMKQKLKSKTWQATRVVPRPQSRGRPTAKCGPRQCRVPRWWRA